MLVLFSKGQPLLIHLYMRSIWCLSLNLQPLFIIEPLIDVLIYRKQLQINLVQWSFLDVSISRFHITVFYIWVKLRVRTQSRIGFKAMHRLRMGQFVSDSNCRDREIKLRSNLFHRKYGFVLFVHSQFLSFLGISY